MSYEEDISVEFSVGGTAVYGEDYLVVLCSFIPAGQTTASIAVEIIEDDVFEGSEEMNFILILLIHAQIGRTSYR